MAKPKMVTLSCPLPEPAIIVDLLYGPLTTLALTDEERMSAWVALAFALGGAAQAGDHTAKAAVHGLILRYVASDRTANTAVQDWALDLAMPRSAAIRHSSVVKKTKTPHQTKA
jgi:hypothetical protein